MFGGPPGEVQFQDKTPRPALSSQLDQNGPIAPHELSVL